MTATVSAATDARPGRGGGKDGEQGSYHRGTPEQGLVVR